MSALTRWLPAVLLIAPLAQATPYTVGAAEQAEIARLARTFFESTRDGGAARTAAYPTPEELRALFPAARAEPGGRGPVDDLIARHLLAVERDAEDLRAVFRGGRFVGLTGALARRGVVDVHRCGRFARTDSQCADGPVVEYAVGSTTRRFRIDTLVRVNGHWRIWDARR